MASSSPPSRKTSRPVPRRLAETPSHRRRRRRRQSPPGWLLVALSACLVLIAVILIARPFGPRETAGPVAAEAAESAEASQLPVPAPTAVLSTPTPEPTPEAVPTPEPTLTPEEPDRGEEFSGAPVVPADSGDWFSDAVFIGDSRVEGFRLYSGVTSEAAFLDHTGLTVYEVKEGKKVIRRGDKKISVLDALSSGTYGKVYIALGVNELGYFDPEGFAETCGEVVEAIRERQPDARIYIQSLIPVNSEKCGANDIPYYITNQGISGYNQALKDYFTGKDVFLLGIPEGLVDENGEVLREYSADGVHFKKDGYVLWLNYLAAHTEG